MYRPEARECLGVEGREREPRELRGVGETGEKGGGLWLFSEREMGNWWKCSELREI